MVVFWTALAAVIAIGIAAYVRNQRSGRSPNRRSGGDGSGPVAAGWSTDWGHGSSGTRHDRDPGSADPDGGGWGSDSSGASSDGGGGGGGDSGGGGGGGGDGGGGGGGGD